MSRSQGKPKKDNMRDFVIQMLYGASGETEQYAETVDACLGAVEIFLTHLAKEAALYPSSQGKINDESIKYALRNDNKKKEYISMEIDKKKSPAQPANPQ